MSSKVVQAYSRINDLDAQASKRNEELQTALIAAKSETENTQKRLAEIETILARFKTLEGELTALKAEMENVTQRLNGDAFRLQLARDLAADDEFKKTVGGEVDSLTTKMLLLQSALQKRIGELDVRIGALESKPE